MGPACASSRSRTVPSAWRCGSASAYAPGGLHIGAYDHSVQSIPFTFYTTSAKCVFTCVLYALKVCPYLCLLMDTLFDVVGTQFNASVGHRPLAAIWGENATVSCTPFNSPWLGSKRSFSPMFSQLVKTVHENEPQVFIPGAQSPVARCRAQLRSLVTRWSLASPTAYAIACLSPTVSGKDRRPCAPAMDAGSWAGGRSDPTCRV
jgi:hypothetical protein